MADNIGYIHGNKLAKLNKIYVGNNGKLYIGLANGRLKLKESTKTTSSTSDFLSSEGSGSGSSCLPNIIG